MNISSTLLYLDPGSGSYLIQMIIAGIVGALFYLKTFWKKIKGIFQKPGKEDPSSGNEQSND